MAVRTAAIYVRISEDRVGAGLGVQRQEADCRALAERLGWSVAAVYVDNDISAFSGKKRPEYNRMLADIEGGAVDAVLAWHTDRLHRRLGELEIFVDLCDKKDVAVQTVTAGHIDLSTPSGRLVAGIVAVTAKYESEHKAARNRRKARELAEAGKRAGGGSRGYGYEPDHLTIRADEARVIREAADRVLAGASLRGICADWNARGIKSPTGLTWKQQVLRRILTSGRIAGWREHHGELVAKAEWPPIIDRPGLDRLRAILWDGSRRTTTVRARRYLLAGFIRCWSCQRRLVARPRADGVRRYVCASGPMFEGCGRTHVLAEPLEDLVVEAILQVIDGPELARLVQARTDARSSADAEALAGDEAALVDLTRDFYANRRISRPEYEAARIALVDQIDEKRRQLARSTYADGLTSLVGVARTRWRDLSLDQRRAVIAAALDHITVGPGRRGFNRFDPTRIDMTWADEIASAPRPLVQEARRRQAVGRRIRDRLAAGQPPEGVTAT